MLTITGQNDLHVVPLYTEDPDVQFTVDTGTTTMKLLRHQ